MIGLDWISSTIYFKGSVAAAVLPAISSGVCRQVFCLLTAYYYLNSHLQITPKTSLLPQVGNQAFCYDRERQSGFYCLWNAQACLLYLPEAFMINADPNIPTMNARFDEAPAEKPSPHPPQRMLKSTPGSGECQVCAQMYILLTAFLAFLPDC